MHPSSRKSFVIKLHLKKKCVSFFYESLQITFPNNVLVSKCHDECGESFTMQVYHLSESSLEQRGRVSRAHLHLKRHAIKQLSVDRAVFDGVKWAYFTLPMRKFNQTVLKTFH